MFPSQKIPWSTVWIKIMPREDDFHTNSCSNFTTSVLNISHVWMCLFSWRWGGSSTQAWMPIYVSILRIPQMIWVWRTTVEWYIDRVKPKNSEINLSQCHFVHHKSEGVFTLVFTSYAIAFGGPVFSVLTIGPKVRGFKPGRWRWISNGDKNLQHAFFQKWSKAVVPMSEDFTAC
jgi:hypothetical protein